RGRPGRRRGGRGAWCSLAQGAGSRDRPTTLSYRTRHFPARYRYGCLTGHGRPGILDARRLCPSCPGRSIRGELAMGCRRREGPDRRDFWWTAAGLVGASGAAAAAPEAPTDDKPPAASPRATSGDAAGPKWQQRLTVTVGPRDADLAGKDDKV